MADAIEEALRDIGNRLCDNIIGDNFKGFSNSMTLETKQRVIKDYYIELTKQFFDALNKEFHDVKFRYKWNCGIHQLDSEMRRITSDVYNEDYTSDNYDFDDLYNEDNNIGIFYSSSLQEINIKIEYFWERTCSLGCLHSQKRFYIVNLPKLVDLIAYYKVGMPIRSLVKDFIPDFFYDPTEKAAPKKRGRPKSSRS